MSKEYRKARRETGSTGGVGPGKPEMPCPTGTGDVRWQGWAGMDRAYRQRECSSMSAPGPAGVARQAFSGRSGTSSRLGSAVGNPGQAPAYLTTGDAGLQ